MNINIKSRNKIVATLGPNISSYNDIIKFLEKGVSTFRINFSHNGIDAQIRKIKELIKIREQINHPFSILIDTKGPEIRVGNFLKKSQIFKRGEITTIFTSHQNYLNKVCLANEMTFSFDIIDSLKVNDLILIDDGKLSIKIISLNKNEKEIIGENLNTHLVFNNKRVNLPGVDLPIPFLSPYDIESIERAIQLDIDAIALSFTNSEKNVLEVKKILKKHNKEHIWIIPKIESQLGLDNLDKILFHSEGIMIARGDLGLEIPFFNVPIAQKRIIKKCREEGKVSIVATQMLDSMEKNPFPTRAEVSDIFFAIELGTDATMLSGETASGNFPFKSVEIMKQISLSAQNEFYKEQNYQKQIKIIKSNTKINSTMKEKIFKIVDLLSKEAIEIVFIDFFNDKTLRAIASLRPNATIIGFTKNKNLANKFGFSSNVYIYNNFEKNQGDFIDFLPEIIKYFNIKDHQALYVTKEKNTIINL